MVDIKIAKSYYNMPEKQRTISNAYLDSSCSTVRGSHPWPHKWYRLMP